MLLDVVYNHVGASGTQGLECFGPYFTVALRDAVGPRDQLRRRDSDAVREWVLQCAEHWIRDFHSTACGSTRSTRSWTPSPEHLVAAITRRVHAARPAAFVIAESGSTTRRCCAEQAAAGAATRVWADDFHHALRVLLTGDREGYYAEFGGARRRWRRRCTARTSTTATTRRSAAGASARPPDDVPPERVRRLLLHHDQVGNRAFGDRLPAEVPPLAAF